MRIPSRSIGGVLLPGGSLLVIMALAAGVSSARPAVVPTGPLSGALFFVPPLSSARRQAEEWRQSRPDDAALMALLSDQPVATWLGDWSGDVRSTVAALVDAARASSRVPVLVAYNLPHRDCGGHSAGGAADADSYRSWIANVASGLAGRPAVVVLEPDGLAGIDCLGDTTRLERFALLKDAVAVLRAAGARVYLDGGHARWHPPDTMAVRLAAAGIAEAAGFALNVSNFVATPVSLAYGDSVSSLVGGKHYVIDTSRNGASGTGDAQWCNPDGQSIGALPTTNTGHALADAFLWIKVPGESDGSCNGGPTAGTWWPEQALALARGQPGAAITTTHNP